MTDVFQLLQDPLDPVAARSVVAGLAFVNALLIYVLGTIVARRAFVRLQKLAVIAIAALIASVGLGISSLLFPLGTAGLWPSMFRLSIAIWWFGLVLISYLVLRVLSVDRLRFRKPKSNFEPFQGTAGVKSFGVRCIDDYVRDATKEKKNTLFFPVLLVASKSFFPWRICNRFAAAGLLRNEGVIYFAFNQPPVVVLQQLAKQFALLSDSAQDTEKWWNGHKDLIGNFSKLVLIDCYSLWIGKTRRGEAVGNVADMLASCVTTLLADPRDPVGLTRRYNKAVRLLRTEVREVRVVYDSISDFLAFSDPQTAMQFIKHSMVWEDVSRANSLYLYVPGIPQSSPAQPVDKEFLRWNSFCLVEFTDEGGDRMMSITGLYPEVKKHAIELDSKAGDYVLKGGPIL